MLIHAIVGAVAFLAGIVAISRPTKNLHPAIKYTPIMLCAIGAFLIWSYCTEIIPVEVNAKVAILEMEPQKMYVSVDPELARRCDLRNLDVRMIDSANVETHAIANLVDPKKHDETIPLAKWNTHNVVEIQVDPKNYESFYFVAHDRCAFGVHVKSEFGHTSIPERFNASLAATLPKV